MATAEALFDRGVKWLEQGDFELACPAIGESYRLDPRPGTLFTLAECEDGRGRIATANALYSDFLNLVETLPPERRARQRAREKAARDKHAALAAELPELTLVLGPSVPSGAVVKRDDVVLARPSLGLGLPVDPGEHALVLEVQGKPAVQRRIKIARREKLRVILDVEERTEPPAPPPAVPAAPALPRAVAPPAPKGPGARRIAAYSLGAVGIAGIGVGAAFGGLAAAKKSALSPGCVDTAQGHACDPASFAEVGPARTLSYVSTTGVVAGAALLATGVVLILTEPKRTPASVTPVQVGLVAVDGTWLAAGLRGRF